MEGIGLAAVTLPPHLRPEARKLPTRRTYRDETGDKAASEADKDTKDEQGAPTAGAFFTPQNLGT